MAEPGFPTSGPSEPTNPADTNPASAPDLRIQDPEEAHDIALASVEKRTEAAENRAAVADARTRGWAEGSKYVDMPIERAKESDKDADALENAAQLLRDHPDLVGLKWHGSEVSVLELAYAERQLERARRRLDTRPETMQMTNKDLRDLSYGPTFVVSAGIGHPTEKSPVISRVLEEVAEAKTNYDALTRDDSTTIGQLKEAYSAAYALDRRLQEEYCAALEEDLNAMKEGHRPTNLVPSETEPTSA